MIMNESRPIKNETAPIFKSRKVRKLHMYIDKNHTIT